MKPTHRTYTSDAASRLTAIRVSEIAPYRRLIVDGLPPLSFNPQRGAFGFPDLIEIRMLALLRAHPGVGAAGAHLIAQEARQSTGLTRPLSSPAFPEQAQQTARSAGVEAELDVARMAEVSDLIERDQEGRPVRWRIGADALGDRDSTITLDPDLHPQAPVAAPSEVTIHEVAYLRKFLAIQPAATRLGISAEQVRDACRLQRMLVIMRSLKAGWDYHHRLAGAPPDDGTNTPGARAAEHSEAVPEPLGRRRVRLSQAGLTRDRRTPFFSLSVHDWMQALAAAAPTVDDLTGPPPLLARSRMNDQQEVRFQFDLSADPQGWIRGQGAAWLQPPGSTGDTTDRPADGTANMILYSEEYPVHEHIARHLRPADPGIHGRLPHTFRQWAEEAYPYSESMNPPPQPETNGAPGT